MEIQEEWKPSNLGRGIQKPGRFSFPHGQHQAA